MRVGISYDVIPHDHSSSSISTATAAHVSGELVAKAVVLKDAKGDLMAVLPATYKLSENKMYDLLGRRLQRHGYRVTMAVDGRQALVLIKQRPFDLALLVLSLPVIN